MSSLSRALQSPFALALLAIALVAPGIWLATGITGKDEFYLGLRTPMEMMASQHWLVPFLDGAPRIKKPPLLYWLGRGSFELFGVSLSSARIVGVLFAALLVASTAGIARRFSGDREIGRVAGMVLLGCLGLHSEGRRFMLDVPVAAFSAAAFWSFLIWQDTQRKRWLSVSSLLLAAGFLVKGPIVALVFGGGIASLFLTKTLSVRTLASHRWALVANILLGLALALPWFVWVRLAYPEAAQLALADEVESRRFFELSPTALLGLLNIGLPWIWVFFAAAWSARREPGLPRQLLLWFLLTTLPFLLLKSFDRYLIGSLVPLAIFLAWCLPRIETRWPWRLGAALTVLLGAALFSFAQRFSLADWSTYCFFPASAYLLWAWWRANHDSAQKAHLLLAPALFHLCLLWTLFPALGVNAIPSAIVELGRTRPIAMLEGPQPALLPILSQRPHRHFTQLNTAEVATLAASNALVFIEADQEASLKTQVEAAGFRISPVGEFGSLASHGSGLRFARNGATLEDWKHAWNTGSTRSLETRILWFEILRP